MKDIGAVILAAGASTRMGRCKALLPLGQGLAIERTIAAFTFAGVGCVVVVVRPDAVELTSLLHDLGLAYVVNPTPAAGMMSSLRAGLAALNPGLRAFFVHPADIPLIAPATLLRLVQAFDTAADQGCLAVSPTHRGCKGHPPLLAAALRTSLLAWNGETGLRGFLAGLADAWRTVECGDAAILQDMDTAADYRRLLGLERELARES